MASSPSAGPQQYHDGEPGTSTAYRQSSEVPARSQNGGGERVDDENEERGSDQPKNLMGEAMERGGFVGWVSCLTFSWAGRLLELGSTSSLDFEGDDLDGLYKTHKR